MIVKTFNSNIDGISNKIGFSKRSFAEWGKQVSEAFSEADSKLKKFSSALKTAFVIPKDYYKNQLGEIVTKDNIDSYIPNLDTDSARTELERLQNIQNEINKTKGSWDDYNNKFKKSEKYLLNYAKQNNVLEASVDNVKQANQAARKAAIKHNEVLKQQTLSAKAGQVALKGLSLALNAVASIGIGLAIDAVVSWISDLVNASEEAMQKASEAASELDSDLNSLDDYKGKIIELKTALDSNTLSYEDAKSKRQDLMDIQNELIYFV